MFNYNAFDGYLAGFIIAAKDSNNPTIKEEDRDYLLTAMICALVGMLESELHLIELDRDIFINGKTTEKLDNYRKYQKQYNYRFDDAMHLFFETM